MLTFANSFVSPLGIMNSAPPADDLLSILQQQQSDTLEQLLSTLSAHLQPLVLSSSTPSRHQGIGSSSLLSNNDVDYNSAQPTATEGSQMPKLSAHQLTMLAIGGVELSGDLGASTTCSTTLEMTGPSISSQEQASRAILRSAERPNQQQSDLWLGPVHSLGSLVLSETPTKTSKPQPRHSGMSQQTFQSPDDLAPKSDIDSLDPLDIRRPEFRTPEFHMFHFKVDPCPKHCKHPWQLCPFAHPSENARRRDPTIVRYCSQPCPRYRRGYCAKGDSCEFAHGVFEAWCHPEKYHTQICKDGANCKHDVCFFAHTVEELRAPTVMWPPAGEAAPSSATDAVRRLASAPAIAAHAVPQPIPQLRLSDAGGHAVLRELTSSTAAPVDIYAKIPDSVAETNSTVNAHPLAHISTSPQEGAQGKPQEMYRLSDDLGRKDVGIPPAAVGGLAVDASGSSPSSQAAPPVVAPRMSNKFARMHGLTPPAGPAASRRISQANNGHRSQQDNMTYTIPAHFPAPLDFYAAAPALPAAVPHSFYANPVGQHAAKRDARGQAMDNGLNRVGGSRHAARHDVLHHMDAGRQFVRPGMANQLLNAPSGAQASYLRDMSLLLQQGQSIWPRPPVMLPSSNPWGIIGSGTTGHDQDK